MTPYPSLFTCFPLTCLFHYSLLISKKIIPKEYPESFDPVSVDSVYDLRFIVMHEGKKFEEGHYYGYFQNLASHRWWKLDDEDVEEVREDVVLDDAYAGDSCAFMLQYVL